ncbi:Rieske 2Fe-2S domain-containing protein [Nocardia sp. NRRL S-836]|uniref:Rieske (2Fe-2S) protein n=1 Tax=Nocardia sp. NRRL S-836 TaxID=1519492 RepID=UPI0007C7B6CB|nr:Rieske 2Fe-2S domain-containing protein [Nocardia sp. NRRL S-836]
MSTPAAEPVVRQLADDLILVEVAGRRILTESECPHRRGRLRYGYVNGRTLRITCPLHLSSFDLTTGRQVTGPPCRELVVASLADGAEVPDADTARALLAAAEEAR